MRWYRFIAVSAAVTIGVSLLSGCGAADHSSDSGITSGTAADTSAFAGDWTGSWSLSVIGSGISVGGGADFSIAKNGTLTAQMENNTTSSYGVFAAGTKRTLHATLTSGGYFTGTITAGSDKDTISGRLIKPVGTTDTLRVPFQQTHQLVQSSGSMGLAKK